MERQRENILGLREKESSGRKQNADGVDRNITERTTTLGETGASCHTAYFQLHGFEWVKRSPIVQMGVFSSSGFYDFMIFFSMEVVTFQIDKNE